MWPFKKKENNITDLAANDTSSRLVAPSEVCHPANSGNDPKLRDITVIYEGTSDSFSLATGRWTDAKFNLNDEMMLLIRWNGADNHWGFPANAGDPQWFPLPNMFAKSILETLKTRLDEHLLDPLSLAKQMGFQPSANAC